MKVIFKEWNCNTVLDKYPNGRLGIGLVEDTEEAEPIGKATVNIPDFNDLQENEIIVKNYSENEGMVDALIEAGIVEPRPRTFATSGFISAPVMKLTEAFIKEVENAK